MILSDVEGYVRQDLFDPAGGSQIWANTDIDRAIDKAVDRYSEYYPNIAYTDMSSQPYQRTYPYPTSWNASYPVWWIERIIYPLQVWGSYFNPPTSAPTAAKASGSGLSIGAYQYVVTFLSQGGETPQSPAGSVTTSSGQQKVNLSSIPLGPATTNTPGTSNSTIIGRNLYRTLVGGSTFFLLTTLQDNTTTTYTDTTADASISSMPSPPTLNTSGVMNWPPIERNFNEYSNIFDSTASLAAGGNLGNMGAVGSAAGQTGNVEPTFTLQLQPNNLPPDNTLIMRIFYATKHQLDTNGSTIPEVHKDTITLGACAYCLEAYQVPQAATTFQFADGGLRDHLDDSMIPVNLAAAAKNKMDQFIARLEEIKTSRDFAASSRVSWGEKGRWFWRL